MRCSFDFAICIRSCTLKKMGLSQCGACRVNSSDLNIPILFQNTRREKLERMGEEILDLWQQLDIGKDEQVYRKEKYQHKCWGCRRSCRHTVFELYVPEGPCHRHRAISSDKRSSSCVFFLHQVFHVCLSSVRLVRGLVAIAYASRRVSVKVQKACCVTKVIVHKPAVEKAWYQ